MGIAADIAEDWHAALAALAWEVEAGADETIWTPRSTATSLRPRPPSRWRTSASAVADPVRPTRSPSPGPRPPSAQSLDALREAITGFDLCDLKKGARNTVFADGNPKARVLILGEAPGAEEDREGRPFVGRAGQLLDRMFAAIGLSRTSPDAEMRALHHQCHALAPPGNRDPEPAEIAMMLPFVERHIALVDPQVIVVVGNTSLFALTGAKGILRARGNWSQALGKPLLPMTHPAYLLRNPAAKREAWADLLSLQARLR
jgi:uracil-DNA glycosylase family 4